jgi:hypothetical protein
MNENVKKTSHRSDHNFGSEGARGMVLWGNESRRRALHDALVKIQKKLLIPKSAANLCECDLVQL